MPSSMWRMRESRTRATSRAPVMARLATARWRTWLPSRPATSASRSVRHSQVQALKRLKSERGLVPAQLVRGWVTRGLAEVESSR